MTLPPLRDRDDPGWHRTARHEAGHAAAAVAMGRMFDHVTLRPHNPRYRGALIGHRMQPRPLGGVVVLLAGPMAIPTDDELDDTDFADLLCTRGYYDALTAISHTDGMSPDGLHGLARRAGRIVRDTHAESVRAVAAALLAHPEQRLTHREVAALVEDHQPGGLEHLLRQHQADLDAQDQRPPGPNSANTDPSNRPTTETVKP